MVGAVENLSKSTESSINTAINELKTERQHARSIKDDVAMAVREVKEAAKTAIHSIDKRHESYEQQQKKIIDSKQVSIIAALIIGICIICGICLKVWANSFSSDIEKEKAAITMLSEQRVALQREIIELQKTQANLSTFGAKQIKLDDGRVGLAFPNSYHKIDLRSGDIFIYKPN